MNLEYAHSYYVLHTNENLLLLYRVSICEWAEHRKQITAIDMRIEHSRFTVICTEFRANTVFALFENFYKHFPNTKADCEQNARECNKYSQCFPLQLENIWAIRAHSALYLERIYFFFVML